MLTALVAGLIMGFASSLHCAGMCGPIGCALITSDPKRDPLLAVLAAEIGKLGAYVALGAAFGLFGAGLYGALNLTAVHLVLQWSASLTIIWMALATFGVVPALAGLDRALAPTALMLARLRAGWAMGGYGKLVISGLIWGAAPCAMVYAAIFNSLLTGSAATGAVMMAGFGLATIPAVTIASIGLARLSRVSATRPGRVLAGSALLTAGAIGLFTSVPGTPFCISL